MTKDNTNIPEEKLLTFLYENSGFCRTLYKHNKTGRKVCWQVDGWYSFNEEPESLLSNNYGFFHPDKDACIHVSGDVRNKKVDS